MKVLRNREPFTNWQYVRRARTGGSTCRRSSATSKHWTHSPKVSGRIMFSSYLSSKCNQIASCLRMNRDRAPIDRGLMYEALFSLFIPFEKNTAEHNNNDTPGHIYVYIITNLKQKCLSVSENIWVIARVLMQTIIC